MIVTTFRIQTTPRNRQEILQTFRSLSGPIQREMGCKSWRIYLEEGNEETVVVIEEWDSRIHWNDHLRSDGFAVMLGAMSLLDKPESVEFQVLAQLDGTSSVEAIKTRNIQDIGNNNASPKANPKFDSDR